MTTRKKTALTDAHAERLRAHSEDLAAGVLEDLKAKGIEGVQVSAIHFVTAGAGTCPPGKAWQCRPDPRTGGVICGCFPVGS